MKLKLCNGKFAIEIESMEILNKMFELNVGDGPSWNYIQYIGGIYSSKDRKTEIKRAIEEILSGRGIYFTYGKIEEFFDEGEVETAIEKLSTKLYEMVNL